MPKLKFHMCKEVGEEANRERCSEEEEEGDVVIWCSLVLLLRAPILLGCQATDSCSHTVKHNTTISHLMVLMFIIDHYPASKKKIILL